jgi:hypothetical protein
MSNIAVQSFDHFIGLHEQRRWYLDPEFFGGFEIEVDSYLVGWEIGTLAGFAPLKMSAIMGRLSVKPRFSRHS